MKNKRLMELAGIAEQNYNLEDLDMNGTNIIYDIIRTAGIRRKIEMELKKLAKKYRVDVREVYTAIRRNADFDEAICNYMFPF